MRIESSHNDIDMVWQMVPLLFQYANQKKNKIRSVYFSDISLSQAMVLQITTMKLVKLGYFKPRSEENIKNAPT